MLVSPNILGHIFLLSKTFTTQGIVNIRVAFYLSLSSISRVTNLLNNRAIVLLLVFLEKSLYKVFLFPRHIHNTPYPTGCLHGADFQPSLDVPFIVCFGFLHPRVCFVSRNFANFARIMKYAKISS